MEMIKLFIACFIIGAGVSTMGLWFFAYAIGGFVAGAVAGGVVAVIKQRNI